MISYNHEIIYDKDFLQKLLDRLRKLNPQVGKWKRTSIKHANKHFWEANAGVDSEIREGGIKVENK